MPIEVDVIQVPGNGRSSAICAAMVQGIFSCGDTPTLMAEHFYTRPRAPVAVFYGLRGNLRKAFKDYCEHPELTAVYIDLGYWGRLQGGRRSGYHKVAINSRHPTDYFQKFHHPKIRLEALNLKFHSWQRDGKHILLAGMGDKAAAVEGFSTEEWELQAIAEIRKHTDRPIIYRPKPSFRMARPLPGADYSPPSQPLEAVLQGCHAVVTHHSNVAVDGLLSGVSALCWKGVAKPLSQQDFSLLEQPFYPDNHRRWAADISFTQWTPFEMSTGLPWRHLKNEGLVPA